jgi:predicted nucleic acid-binding protein
VPSEEIIIADSSPLIGLARIGQLGLLPQLAKRIVVPRAVHAEVTSARVNAPGAADVAAQKWIEVLDADPAVVAPLLILVGKGEAEGIALAQRQSAAVLLIDDLRARKLAERLGLRRMGTVALLGRAKQERLIPKLKPALDALVANGIFIRQELIAAALQETGE